MNTGLYRRVFTDGEAIELFGAHADGLDNMEKCQTFYFRENYGYMMEICEFKVFGKEYLDLLLLETFLLISKRIL